MNSKIGKWILYCILIVVGIGGGIGLTYAVKIYNQRIYKENKKIQTDIKEKIGYTSTTFNRTIDIIISLRKLSKPFYTSHGNNHIQYLTNSVRVRKDITQDTTLFLPDTTQALAIWTTESCTGPFILGKDILKISLEDLNKLSQIYDTLGFKSPHRSIDTAYATVKKVVSLMRQNPKEPLHLYVWVLDDIMRGHSDFFPDRSKTKVFQDKKTLKIIITDLNDTNGQPITKP